MNTSCHFFHKEIKKQGVRRNSEGFAGLKAFKGRFNSYISFRHTDRKR